MSNSANPFHKDVERASTTDGLPVAPSLEPALQAAQVPSESTPMTGRVLWICTLSLGLAIVAAFVAQGLVRLIAMITNLSFFGRLSLSHVSPAEHHLGWWVILVPVIGGIVVGLMARYGSQAIRGHGIPEAMEQVLTNQSRIPARLTFLKPLSSAIAIGTGGPFGAEGPIIATGGALGSLVGQLLHTTADERKTLLAAGAGAGMAATFGAPVSAVLLTIELLLFEFRARSFIPVALATSAAAAVRLGFEGADPMFPMPDLSTPTGFAIATYVIIGALVGVASVGTTKIVYWIEDLFDHLPVHWMWWPAIGGLAVGIVGYFAPRTLGVGYSNITDIISNNLGTLSFIAFLCAMKFVSWSISLGSGTSGGTLAPLFTIGSGIGALLGAGAVAIFPDAGIDVRIAALVGMAAIFAGASRAMLASAVFAFETTLQPLGLLPLLGGCTAAYLVSSLLMRHTIMTEKIARRGVRVPAEYAADALEQILVAQAMSHNPVTLRTNQSVSEVLAWVAERGKGTEHQGYPVLNEAGHLVGVVTRRKLYKPDLAVETRMEDLIERPPVVVYDDNTLRNATDHMVRHEIGRLPVIRRIDRSLVGILTRSDVLTAHRQRLPHGQS